MSTKYRQQKKLQLFLNVVGAETCEELKKIFIPDKPSDKTFDEVRKLLEDHFSPKYTIMAERCNFNRRMQQESESIKDFLTELKHLARNCEFKNFLNDALRDRLVAGIRDPETQRVLFATERLTFEGAYKIALEKELADRQTKELRVEEARPIEVNAVRPSCKGKKRASSDEKDCSAKKKSVCHRCGKGYGPARCCYRNAKC